MKLSHRMAGAALLCALALTFLPALFGAASAQAQTATVCNDDPTDRLNLRTQPKKDAVSLGKYYSGVTVELLGEKKNGYVKVRISPVEGWMDEQFLTNQVTSDAPPTTTVTTDGANLRAQPTMSSKSLGTFAVGTWVCVLGVRDDGWLHVSVSDKTGFMRDDLVAASFSYHKNGQITAGNGYAVVNNPVSTDRLNLRASPNANSAVLGKYYNGVLVEVLDTTPGGWAHVRIAGTAEGYMQAKFLAMNGEAVTAFPLISTIQNRGGSGLHLRETPSTSAKSLGLFENGTQVSVLGVWQNGWVHVTVNGKYGYMQADKFDGDLGLTFAPLPEGI